MYVKNEETIVHCMRYKLLKMIQQKFLHLIVSLIIVMIYLESIHQNRLMSYNDLKLSKRERHPDFFESFQDKKKCLF